MSSSPSGLLPFCPEFLGRDVLGQSGEDLTSSVWGFKAWGVVRVYRKCKQYSVEGKQLSVFKMDRFPEEGEQDGAGE